MKTIRPTYCDSFSCAGELCPAQCPAPLDMTWTRTIGEVCETGLALACPKAAELILLQKDQTTYVEATGTSENESHIGEQEARILDARKTMDLLLQDRAMGFRPGLVLALTYSAALEPLIAAKNRYAYEELDWGFTEQPTRQFQALVQFVGNWELKRSDMCNILREFQQLCAGDGVLTCHLEETVKLFETLSGEAYRLMRDQFDQYMSAREYLFENLLCYYVHRYFTADAKAWTVAPGVKLMAVSAAVLRTLAARVWQETGNLTDEAFVAMCWHYARCVEESQENYRILREHFERMPLYSWERLQRLLWQ